MLLLKSDYVGEQQIYSVIVRSGVCVSDFWVKWIY